MSSRPVVRQVAVISKTWSGNLKVDYRCPWCNRDLASGGDEVSTGGQCPNCGKSFHFDDAIQSAFAAEQRQQEQALAQRHAAAKAKGEEKRQLREEEETRRRAESEAFRRQSRELSEQRERVERRQEEQYVRDIRGVRDGATVVLVLAGLLCALGAFISVIAAFKADTTYGSGMATLHGMSAAFAIGGLLGTFLTYALFRCLFAVHGLLLEIRAALERQSQTHTARQPSGGGGSPP